MIAGMVTGELPGLEQVHVGDASPERLLTVAAPDALDDIRHGIAIARTMFAGHAVWSVNSTAQGGGVAEMLQSLVPYARGAGVDARWVVITGDDKFFHVTKRIHNRLHGASGDGGQLGPDERDHYEDVARINAERLLRLIAPSDIIMLHDPQTAGLIPLLRAAGLPVVWRCHVGVLEPNDLVRQAWDFLRPYVREANVAVFSTQAFVWDGLDPARTAIIAPSIDPFSAKNCELEPSTVSAILDESGLIRDPAAQHPARFQRSDGGDGRIAHRSEVTEETTLAPSTPLVLQVSRWDRLKDPAGVMRGFVDHVVDRCSAHLMLAGPSVAHVTDDPEGLATAEAVQSAWRKLPLPVRERIHLVTLQMHDVEENAIVVNALQRHAHVVVQKSLAEGFGLTVAEAMWKGRPVVASRVGGIPDQIEDGVTGCLVDPLDLVAFGENVAYMFTHPQAARRMGRAAEERVRERFLGSRHLLQYLDLLSGLLRR